jgi:hypothetical protein
MTVALRDQYNQPLITTEDMNVRIEFSNGNLELVGATSTEDFVSAIIPAGRSEMKIQLQSRDGAPALNFDSPVAQLLVAVDTSDKQAKD